MELKGFSMLVQSHFTLQALRGEQRGGRAGSASEQGNEVPLQAPLRSTPPPVVAQNPARANEGSPIADLALNRPEEGNKDTAGNATEEKDSGGFSLHPD